MDSKIHKVHQNASRNRFITLYYLILIVLHLIVDNSLNSIFINASYLKKIAYLTNISFFSNLFYYAWMCLVSGGLSQLHSTRLEKEIFRFNFALSFVVVGLYWSIALIDYKMLSPNGIVLPLHIDVFLHGCNFVINVAELLYVNPKSDSGKANLKFYLGFLVFYSCLLQYLKYQYDLIVYPLVGMLGVTGYIFLSLVGLLLLFIGDYMYLTIIKLGNKFSSKSIKAQ